MDIVTLQILEEYLQKFKGCVIVVSHDRYFMDKVVDHLLVFNGEGDIRDFPGNYTEYRGWKDEKLKLDRANASQTKISNDNSIKKVRLNDKRKMSFKEKQEFIALEKDISALEEEKAEIEAALSGGLIDVNEITKLSKRLPILNDELDTKSMRWLELSEIE